MAYNDYLDHNSKKSIRKCAKEHGVIYESLRDRINRAKPKAQEAESR